MTDITELAQREKFEAWWEREYKHLESSKYTDAVPHIKYGFWMAYQAGGAELVEALEKAQTIRAAAEKLVRCKGRYHSEQNYRALAALFGVNTPDLPPLEHENVHYADAAEMEIAALRQRIADLESRTVTFKVPFTPEPSAFAPWAAKAFYQFHKDTVKSCVAVFSDACAAAGIKVEAE
ncbi:ead/Ea22-like family protein [Klebsiella pneumoniae]|uniref:ead/Ea22-like family protein n=1 Tax=Klebsiella pneumoniae TaxID=573 RepID=UPI0020CC076F|nr:ead/Ea22-like family protein [Klebsiella pneumoniae]